MISFCISKLVHCCVGLSVGNATYNKQINIVLDRSSYAAGVDFWISVSSWSVGGPQGHQLIKCCCCFEDHMIIRMLLLRPSATQLGLTYGVIEQQFHKWNGARLVSATWPGLICVLALTLVGGFSVSLVRCWTTTYQRIHVLLTLHPHGWGTLVHQHYVCRSCFDYFFKTHSYAAGAFVH